MGAVAPFSKHWCETAHSAYDEALELSSPGEVRRIILEQHERIRSLLRRLERRATRLLATPVSNASEQDAARRSALALCSVMTWHIEVENRILLPLLEHADAWGPVRAANVRADHDEQLLFLQAYANALAHPSGSGAALALMAWQLVEIISEDMEQEEAGVLNLGLLKDEACFSPVEAG